MFGPWFALSVAALALVAAMLAAASVREQPRPLLGVHGLTWVVVHGLWRPPGAPGLGFWLVRFAMLYAVVYPFSALLYGIRVLPGWVPDAEALAFVAVCGAVGAAAVGGAPWWSSELTAGPEGLRVTGRWPRTPVALRWSGVSEIRVTGRDLVIEGPERQIVLSMGWGPRALLVEVAALLEATRLSAVPSTQEPTPLPPPPPELDALLQSARPVERRP